MEQEAQTTTCPDHGIQEIIEVDSSHLVNKEPLAFSVTAKLACGHLIKVIMSDKNLRLARAAGGA
jgi:hypothetical protein